MESPSTTPSTTETPREDNSHVDMQIVDDGDHGHLKSATDTLRPSIDDHGSDNSDPKVRIVEQESRSLHEEEEELANVCEGVDNVCLQVPPIEQDEIMEGSVNQQSHSPEEEDNKSNLETLQPHTLEQINSSMHKLDSPPTNQEVSQTNEMVMQTIEDEEHEKNQVSNHSVVKENEASLSPKPEVASCSVFSGSPITTTPATRGESSVAPVPPSSLSCTSSSSSCESVISWNLFKTVRFSICEDVHDVDKVKIALTSAGAKFLNYLGDSATHLIADNPDHSYVTEAVEIYEKPVVTSQWVWLSLRANHILPLSPFLPSSLGERLFSKLVFCPSQLSMPDCGRIWSMVTFYGGAFQVNLNKQVTHLVTNKIDGRKYEIASKRGTITVVTPDWIIDSVRGRKLCETSRYHPRLLVTYNQQYANKMDDKKCKTSNETVSSGSETLPKATKSSVTMAISTDTVSRKADGAPKDKVTSSSSILVGSKAQILQSPSAAAKFFHPPTPPPGTEADGDGSGETMGQANKGPGRPKGSANTGVTKPKAVRRRPSASNVKATKSAPAGAPKAAVQTNQSTPQLGTTPACNKHINQTQSMPSHQVQLAKPGGNEPNQQTQQIVQAQQHGEMLQQQQPMQSMPRQQQPTPPAQAQQYQQNQFQTGTGKPRAYLYQQQQQQQQAMFVQQSNAATGNATQQYQARQFGPAQQQQQQVQVVGSQQSAQQQGMTRLMIPVGMQQTQQAQQRVMAPGPQQQQSQMLMQQQQQTAQQGMQMQQRSRQPVPYQQQQSGPMMSQQAGPVGMVQYVTHQGQMMQMPQQQVQRVMTPMTQQQQQIMIQNQQYQQATGEAQMNMQTTQHQPQTAQFMQRMPVNMVRVPLPMDQAKMMQAGPQPGAQQQSPYPPGVRLRAAMQQQQPSQVIPNGPQRMIMRPGMLLQSQQGQQTQAQMGQYQQQMRATGKPMQYMRASQPGMQQAQQRWQGPNGQTMIIQDGQTIVQPNHQVQQSQQPPQHQQQQQQQQYIQIQRSVAQGQQPPQQQQVWVQQQQMLQQNQQHVHPHPHQQQQYRLQQPQAGVRMGMQPGTRMVMQQAQHQHGQDMNKVRLHTNNAITSAAGRSASSVLSEQTPPPQQHQQVVSLAVGPNGQPVQQLPHMQQTATKILVHTSQGNNGGQNFQISLLSNNAAPGQPQATVMLTPTTIQHNDQSDSLRQANNNCHAVNNNNQTSSVVGEKTKTALANLLNNRLNMQQSNGQQQQQPSPPAQANPATTTIASKPANANCAPVVGNVVQIMAKPPPAVASVVANVSNANGSSGPAPTAVVVASQASAAGNSQVVVDGLSMMQHGMSAANGKIPGVYGPGGMLPSQHMMMAAQMGTPSSPGVVQPHPSSGMAPSGGGGGGMQFVNIRGMNVQTNSMAPGQVNVMAHPSLFRPTMARNAQALAGANNHVGELAHPAAASHSAGAITPGVSPSQHMVQIRFFGHDTKLNIPVEMCFFRCVFYIAPNYTANPKTASLVAGWKKQIARHGGEVVDHYTPGCPQSAHVTHVVTENMTGLLSTQALKDNKRCVTIFWLDDVIRNKRLLPPWRFYHLPVTFGLSTKPCLSFIISITNFEGEERDVVKYMVERIGARFTKYMTSRTTILICKKLGGKKCQMAKLWRIPTVNLLWLQDVLFGSHEPLQVNNIAAKYNKFDPNQSNLTSLTAPIGPGPLTPSQMIQMDTFKVDYHAIQPLMLPWRTPLKLKDDEVMAMKRKIDQEKGIKDNLSGIIDAVAQGAVGEANKSGKQEVEEIGNACTPIKTTLIEDGQMARPAGDAKLQLRFDGSQWSNQATKRSIDTMTAVVEKGVGVSTPTKDVLVVHNQDEPQIKRARMQPSTEVELMMIHTKLEDNLEDEVRPLIDEMLRRIELDCVKLEDSIADNSNDCKPSHEAENTIVNIKMEQDESLEEIPITVAAAVDADNAASTVVNGETSSTSSSNEESTAHDNAQLFKVPLVTKTIDVLLTGFSVADQERYTAMVDRLGGRVVDNPSRCTHLVVPSSRFTPTIKFFIALAQAEHLLGVSWLQESDTMGSFVPVCEEHVPHDPHFERAYKLSLKDVLQERNGRLFEGMVFAITRSVVPSPLLMQSIIQAFGGEAVLKRLPSKHQLNHLFEEQKKRFVLITAREDYPLCEFLNDINNIEIVNAKFIFESILTHQLNFSKHNLRSQIVNGAKEVAIASNRYAARLAALTAGNAHTPIGHS